CRSLFTIRDFPITAHFTAYTEFISSWFRCRIHVRRLRGLRHRRPSIPDILILTFFAHLDDKASVSVWKFLAVPADDDGVSRIRDRSLHTGSPPESRRSPYNSRSGHTKLFHLRHNISYL